MSKTIPDIKTPALVPLAAEKPDLATATAPTTTKREWNTKNLLPRLATDAAAAASAAIMVAPLITIIDKSALPPPLSPLLSRSEASPH